MNQISFAGFLRLHDIIGRKASERRDAIEPLIPVSRSTWWAGVRSGRYPKPTRALGERITAWRIEDIRAFLERAATDVATGQKRCQS